jgi:hypothetical protein
LILRVFCRITSLFLGHAYNSTVSAVLEIADELSQDLVKSKLKNVGCALSLQISSHIVFFRDVHTYRRFL